MSWRTVVISSVCKLDVNMGFLVVRGEETKKIFLDEIAILMIENPAVSLTGCLIEALTEKKVKVIFCDFKRMPAAELIPYRGCYDKSRKIRAQIEWSNGIKELVWTEIVTDKIRKQAEFLKDLSMIKEEMLLKSYINQIELFDVTNREGHAAKVYFNAVFGMDFTRSADNPINAALNYGYSVLLSAFNREVAANGYLTQLGLFHNNMFNQFNLSSDLMEPFRVLIDRKVKNMEVSSFGKEEKHRIIDVLNDTVSINRTSQTVLNAIRLYTLSVFEALNEGDLSALRFFDLEKK